MTHFIENHVWSNVDCNEKNKQNQVEIKRSLVSFYGWSLFLGKQQNFSCTDYRSPSKMFDNMSKLLIDRKNSAVFNKRKGSGVRTFKKIYGKINDPIVQNEITILEKLKDNKNVVHIKHIEEDGDYTILEFEEVLFTNLERRIVKEKTEMPLSERIRIAHVVASCMADIHSKKIIHADLKMSNIFIDVFGNIKICNFGLALYDNPEGHFVKPDTKKCGSPAFMAPERFDAQTKTITEKVDVYAFGIVLWQILESKRAFKGIIDNIAKNIRETNITRGDEKKARELLIYLFLQEVSRGARPKLGKKYTQKRLSPIGRLMTFCWTQKPEDRPPFSFICKPLLTDALITFVHFVSPRLFWLEHVNKYEIEFEDFANILREKEILKSDEEEEYLKRALDVVSVNEKVTLRNFGIFVMCFWTAENYHSTSNDESIESFKKTNQVLKVALEDFAFQTETCVSDVNRKMKYTNHRFCVRYSSSVLGHIAITITKGGKMWSTRVKRDNETGNYEYTREDIFLKRDNFPDIVNAVINSYRSDVPIIPFGKKCPCHTNKD